MSLRYFPAAREDIKAVLRWSLENFGPTTFQRYKALLLVALSDIHANPKLAHSYELPGLQPGIRLYHLKHSRNRAPVDGQIVKQPRHFIAYTVGQGEITIVRVLHERMQILTQLTETLKSDK